MGQHIVAEFMPLNVAVLTVSDTRTQETDTSGQALVDGARGAGHEIVDRTLIPDDVYLMRAVVSAWIADPQVQVVLITGGTGFTGRDSTPEAIKPLFDKEVEGFGELFRAISYQEIGTSTVQSRAIAGLANGTVVFCMPGSTNACKTAWNKIIAEQLDARHKPCNFVGLLKQPGKSAEGSEKPGCGPRG
ncbi:molybdenum cofactor biosynthesis protein B [Hahella sp. NBU794]|uniref:molybdenum cofactor biosynthesis protein B n=1 Tax=Hahella sp. NBU794 TaxID=3422590 RepID=UPI003D6DB448